MKNDQNSLHYQTRYAHSLIKMLLISRGPGHSSCIFQASNICFIVHSTYFAVYNWLKGKVYEINYNGWNNHYIMGFAPIIRKIWMNNFSASVVPFQPRLKKWKEVHIWMLYHTMLTISCTDFLIINEEQFPPNLLYNN